MRSPSQTSSRVSEFAQAPGAFLAVGPGTKIVDRERYFATVAGDGRYVHATRLSFDPSDTREVVDEVHALAPGGTASWVTTSRDLAEALRAAGARDPEPPLEPRFTALATETEPPAVDGIEVRRVETFGEFMTGLEIELSAGGFTEASAARRRAEAAETYARRRSRPGGEWLAFLDGEAVAWAGAIAGPRGLYLAGGATRPAARNRGAYRALVRARWDYAVLLGTPALVVHAQALSRRILERCGFAVVCTMYELESDAR
jgi:acetyltransferase (GNAT) family protein